MSTYRVVNALALAAERAGRGFAYHWCEPGFDQWDDITRVVFDGG